MQGRLAQAGAPGARAEGRRLQAGRDFPGAWRDMGALSEMRRTKIVCTIGPAITPEICPARVETGLKVARLHYSHGTHAEHRARYGIIKNYLGRRDGRWPFPRIWRDQGSVSGTFIRSPSAGSEKFPVGRVLRAQK